MKPVYIGIAIVFIIGCAIYAAGSYSGSREAKAAKAETAEIQKQIDADAKTTEEAKTAVEEKEAAEEELAKQVEKNERQREEIKEQRLNIKNLENEIEVLREALEREQGIEPATGELTKVPVPNHIPGGGDDDFDIPGWMCPTRFC